MDSEALVLSRSWIVYWIYIPFTLLNIIHTRVIRPVWQFILSPRGLEIVLAIITILGIGRYRSNMSLVKTPPHCLLQERQQALFNYRPAPPPPPTFIDQFTQAHPRLAPILSFLTSPNTSQAPIPERLQLNSANLPAGVLYYTRSTSPYSLLNGGWQCTELHHMLSWELFFRSARHNHTALNAPLEPITPFSSNEEIKTAAVAQIFFVQREIFQDPGIKILRPASFTPRRVYSSSDEDLSWLDKLTARLYPFLVVNKLKGPFQKRFSSYTEEEKAMEEDFRVQDPDKIHYRARDIIDALVLAHATLVYPAARCQYHLASESPDWYGVPFRGSCGKSDTLPGTWQGHLEEYRYRDLEWGSVRSWLSLGRWWNFVSGSVKRLQKEGFFSGIGSWLGMGEGLESKTVEVYEKVYWWDVWKEQREQQHRRRWRAHSPLLEVFVKPTEEAGTRYGKEEEEGDKSWYVRFVPAWLRRQWRRTFRRDTLWENIILSEELRAWAKLFLFLTLVFGLTVPTDSWFVGRGYSFNRWLRRWLLVGFLWRYV